MTLRNREVPIVKNREIMHRPSTIKPRNNIPLKDPSKNVPEPKAKEKKYKNVRHAEKTPASFSIETIIAKIKIFVPLMELLKNVYYQSQITKVLKPLVRASPSQTP